MTDFYIPELDVMVTSKQTIHEHKAPTDDSIRLLNEFQTKAKESIIAKCDIKDNTINGVTVAFSSAHHSASLKGEVWIKFSINGEEFNLKEDYNVFEPVENEKLEMYLKDRLKAKVAEQILKLLTIETLKKLKAI